MNAFLADLVVVIHLLFVLFVVLGWILVIRRPKLAWIHVPAAVWGFLIEVAGWICPLTPLENELRRRAGESGYEGGFVENYMLPILYPEGLTRGVQLFLGGSVLVINGIAYAYIFWRRRRRAE